MGMVVMVVMVVSMMRGVRQRDVCEKNQCEREADNLAHDWIPQPDEDEMSAAHLRASDAGAQDSARRGIAGDSFASASCTVRTAIARGFLATASH